MMKITSTPFLVVLSAVLGIGALALLFIYLPYVNSKEAESMRQPLDTQLTQKNLDAAAAKSREREARLQALEGRRQNFERQAEELQQKRKQSWNERQDRQRRLEHKIKGERPLKNNNGFK